MKSLQKFILPGLIILSALVIYLVYFSPKEGLGSFSDFDPNNNANKDIRVQLVKEKGIDTSSRPGSSIFYVVDRNGISYMIDGPLELPPGILTANVVILRGHLHKNPDYFHASSVRLD
jgi:hypothetical protein